MSAAQAVDEKNGTPTAAEAAGDVVFVAPDVERELPLVAGDLRAGRFCTVRFFGVGALRQALPDEVLEVLPPAIREHVTRLGMYMIPKKGTSEQHPDIEYGRAPLSTLGERFRRLPTSSRLGLLVFGFDPTSSGRWIPDSAFNAFLAQYTAYKAELDTMLGAMDEDHALLQAAWAERVNRVCDHFQLKDAVRQHMLDAFPKRFRGLAFPRLTTCRISNPVAVDEQLTAQMQARAARTRAETDLAAAEAGLREREDLARAAAQQAVRQVDMVFDQLQAMLFDDLNLVLAGVTAGGKKAGGAMRRLKGLLERFQVLKSAGSGESWARLESLMAGVETEGQQFSRGRSGRAQEAARERLVERMQAVIEDVRPAAQAWTGLNESVRAVAEL